MCFQDRVDAIANQAENFVESDHFDAPAIKAKKDALCERYEALEEPVVEKRQKLSDSLDFQQFLHDVEDEEAWIREKEPVASSLNTGRTSFSSVYNVQSFSSEKCSVLGAGKCILSNRFINATFCFGCMPGNAVCLIDLLIHLLFWMPGSAFV